ncbi:efflux RND transporter periplasmic adaptor subunit [Photobacterium minamisatsumaniensis]|uniref:efflux RND transporter periplasmic adaptor subunit n=1 Tax=Photobacterium minamisatsumaniensis TaxID=2910233 RepID=UPI003D0E90B1
MTAMKFVLIAFVFFSLYIGKAFLNKNALPDESGTNIEYIKPRIATMVQSIDSKGIIESGRMVEVGAQVSGVIQEIHVSIGDEVSLGELLIEIDPTLAMNELKNAENELSRLNSNVDLMDQLLQYVIQEYERVHGMYIKEAATQVMVDEKTIEVIRARHALVTSKYERDVAKVGVSTKKAQLEYTKLHSAIEGTVVSIMKEKGQTLVSTQNVSPILKIADTNNLLVKLLVSEIDFPKIIKGMDVEYYFLGNRSKVYRSKIEYIDVLPNINHTKSTYYNVYFPIKEHKYTNGLILGISVKASIISTIKKDATVIPIQYVTEGDYINGGSGIVNVLTEDNRIISREVTFGVSDGIDVEVVDGLLVDDKVIISGYE